MLLGDEAKGIVLSAIRHWDGLRIELDAAVVMPDHVHLICRVLEEMPLGAVLKSIKGFSARAINRRLGRTGPLWLDESFDHIIRHEQEWDEKVAYVRDNPARRGLVNSWQEYPCCGSGKGQPNQKDDRLENLSHGKPAQSLRTGCVGQAFQPVEDRLSSLS
jgi:REP element-mobilizing transposase RayT